MRHSGQTRLFLTLIFAIAVGGCAATGADLIATGKVYRTDLNDDKVATVQRGDSIKTLVERLGEPYQKIRFEFLRSTAWDYRFMDTFGYWTEISFMIDDEGRVKESIRNRITGGKDDR